MARPLARGLPLEAASLGSKEPWQSPGWPYDWRGDCHAPLKARRVVPRLPVLARRPDLLPATGGSQRQLESLSLRGAARSDSYTRRPAATIRSKTGAISTPICRPHGRWPRPLPGQRDVSRLPSAARRAGFLPAAGAPKELSLIPSGTKCAQRCGDTRSDRGGRLPGGSEGASDRSGRPRRSSP